MYTALHRGDGRKKMRRRKPVRIIRKVIRPDLTYTQGLALVLLYLSEQHGGRIADFVGMDEAIDHLTAVGLVHTEGRTVELEEEARKEALRWLA